jgi:hypothetical protein
MIDKIPIHGKYHFSIDDVFEELLEISDADGKLFDSPFFLFLKEMHEKYGTHSSLYLFYEKNIDGKFRSLKEIKSFSKELVSIDWLHFAPHAKNFETPPFEQSVDEFNLVCENIYYEIDRIFGKKNASMVRLHFYSEIYELADYFSSKKVVALYTTDRDVGAYRLPNVNAQELLLISYTLFNNIFFIRTHFRLEDITSKRFSDSDIFEMFDQYFKQYGFITIYSHEYELRRSEVRNTMRRCLSQFEILDIKSLEC